MTGVVRGRSVATLYTLNRSRVFATCIANNEMTCLRLGTTTMEATTAVRDTDVLCAKIVETVADQTDDDPLSMTPLTTVLDPEALDALVNGGTDVQVTFEYEDHTVLVCSDGTILVDGTGHDAASIDGGR